MVDSSYHTHSQISIQFNSKKLQTHLTAVLCIESFRENNLGQIITFVVEHIYLIQLSLDSFNIISFIHIHKVYISDSFNNNAQDDITLNLTVQLYLTMSYWSNFGGWVLRQWLQTYLIP